MTKRQMIEEMMEGLNYQDKEKVITNCSKNTFQKIRQVYNDYQKSDKSNEQKNCSIALLEVLSIL